MRYGYWALCMEDLKAWFEHHKLFLIRCCSIDSQMELGVKYFLLSVQERKSLLFYDYKT